MSKVLVVHPDLKPPGGGGGTAWILESLRRDHAVTLLTLEPVSLDAVNRCYGTSLEPGTIRVVCGGRGVTRVLDRPVVQRRVRNRPRERDGDPPVPADGSKQRGRP